MTDVWSPLRPLPGDAELLGERESHSAAFITGKAGDSIEVLSTLVVVGGFVEGEHRPDIVGVTGSHEDWVSHLAGYSINADELEHPPFAWQVLATDTLFEREGATLTPITTGESTSALLIAGMSSDYDCLNDVVELSISPKAQFSYKTWEVTGQIPPPRARHAACAISSHRVLIFGGETADSQQTNDMFVLDGALKLWTQVTFPVASPAPQPRVLSAIAVVPNTKDAHSTATSVTVVLYGGAYFTESDGMASLDDAWHLTMPIGPTVGGEEGAACHWDPVRASEGKPLARCNGHVAFSQPEESRAVFVTGKDREAGSEDITVSDGKNMTICEVYSGTRPEPWRYTASSALYPGVNGVTVAMIVAGQCRHSDPISCYALSVVKK